MIELGIDLADRIGSVTQVTPVEVVGDVAGDVEVGERELLVQWGEITHQVGVGHLKFLC